MKTLLFLPILFSLLYTDVKAQEGDCDINISATITDASSPNTLDGLISLVVNGCDSVFSYVWYYDGQIIESFAPLGPDMYPIMGLGEYCVDVYCSNNCIAEWCGSIGFEESGDCVDESQIDETTGCIEIWDPVCGCDGVTYSNDCYAEYYGGITSWVNGECEQNNDCEIWDAVAEPYDCDSAGYFYVDMSFQHEGTSDYFQLTGNGNNYGPFAYGESSYVVGPLYGDGETIYEFVVQDLYNPNCMSWDAIDPIDCSDCLLWDFNIEFNVDNSGNIECFDDGTFQATIDFNYQNVNDWGFDFYYNQEFVSFHSYYELPLTINLPATSMDIENGGWSYIQVFNNDDEECWVGEEFLTPCIETSVAESESIEWSIYPNPAQDILLLQSNRAFKLVEIRNVLGQLMLQENAPKHTLLIETLPTGNYMLEAVTEQGFKYRKKLIIK